MSLSHEKGTGALTVRARDRAGGLPLTTRMNRALLSVQRWPWVLLDVFAALVLFEVGLRASPYGGYDTVISPYVALSLVYAVSFGSISLGLGSYDRDRRFSYFAIGRSTLIAAVLATLFNLAFHYFTLYAVVGRLTLVYGAIFSGAGVFAMRSAIALIVRQHPYRFTMIGGASAAQERLHAWVDGPERDSMHQLVPWESIFQHGQPLTPQALVKSNVAEIVVASDSVSDDEAIDIALLGLKANVPVVSEHAFFARVFERLPVDEISKRWILEEGLARPQAMVVAAKRASDVALAGLGLIILSPILALVALTIRLSSEGPVFFIQTRQGQFLEPFRMFKFRTMQADADASGGFTRVHDVRITGVGRLLRKTHLDELPQLFNVLRGEMSLVGPRPETVEFAQRMHKELPLYELRYLVRPGLTGHAQIKQGYAMDTVLDTQAKLSYDLYYLCNYTARMDIQILLRTFVFLLRGAR